MNKVSVTLSLIVLALLSLLGATTAFAQQPPDNVGGNWTIYATNATTGETEIKHVQIAQYGNRITGYFEGPNQSGPIEGEVDVHHIRFSTVTRNVITFRGQIYGNNMSGDAGIHGKHAPWQAVRTSGGDVAAPAPTAAVNYTQPVLVPQTPAPAYVPQQATPQYAQQTAPQYPNSYAPQNGQAPATTYQSSYAPAPTYQQSYAPTPGPAPAPLTSEQLNALVAPIALYPDSLVAQVLAAATNPDQISAAEYWMSQNTNLTGSYLAQAVDQQDWDPSVKALTQFPSVLADMAKNLAWTSSLGQAYQNQGADVMAAVQVMRAKAQEAGTLQSNSQITVTQQAPSVIVIQPANPQVVYVPQYNPTVVFGAPVVVPLYTPPVAFATAGVSFGAGVSIGAFFGGGGVVAGGGFGWGWHAWAVNWGGGGGGSTIIYNHTTYINNNTWHSTSYNGYHPWGPGPHGPGPYGPHGYVGPNGYYHPDAGYHPGTDTHYGPNGGYHPNGYYGPDGGWHPNAPGTNPAHQPNGGNNGNHGLIGGNGGVQNPNAGKNGPGVAPNGGYHNYTNNNGTLGSENHIQEARNMDRSNDMNRSRMSGDGARNRAESDRGRASMAGRQHPQHVAREHAPAEHHSSGGEHRR